MDHLEQLVADCINVYVCVYGGGWDGCLVLEAKIPRSVFDGAECCRVTWNIGFGRERTVPRSGNSFSVEASQRLAIILHFYLLKQVEKIRFVRMSKGYDEIRIEEFSDNEELG